LQIIEKKTSDYLIERLWDLWCIVSVIGIWPRFIEPELLFTSRHTIAIPELPKELDGLKIVQISDLHFSHHTTSRFLERISKKIAHLTPDIIVFTGDLLTYSNLDNSPLLHRFLSSLHAPLGRFAILGNHDYSEYVTMANDGTFYKTADKRSEIIRGFSRLFMRDDTMHSKEVVKEPVEVLDPLIDLYSSSGFQVLQNETIHIGRKRQWVNLTGLGDLMAHQCLPQKAFQNYDMQAPGIILSHNPDSFPILESYPGNLYLFGHTHGGQVNLPGIWKRITAIQNKELKSGLFHINDRYLYVNRGLGAPLPFRWLAPPEISLLTLVRQGAVKSSLLDSLFTEEVVQKRVYGTSKTTAPISHV
jgi:uncharacterized protein